MSSKLRARSFSKGVQGRDPSRPQFAADLGGGAAFASRRGGDTGGLAGAADGEAGAANGGARGGDAFAEGVGPVAGGIDADEGAADGVAEGVDGDGVGDGDAATADGVGTGAAGSPAVSLDRHETCSLTNDLTDDAALSALARMASARSGETKRKAENSK